MYFFIFLKKDTSNVSLVSDGNNVKKATNLVQN